jgi:hypothetical protein
MTNNMKRMWFVKQAEVHLDLIDNYFTLGWNFGYWIGHLIARKLWGRK